MSTVWPPLARRWSAALAILTAAIAIASGAISGRASAGSDPSHPSARDGRAAGVIAPGARIDLARGWRLRVGRPRPGAGNAGFRPATVPGVFNTHPLARLYNGTVGTYVLRFRVAAAPAGQQWVLHFERVRRVARVYLNGRLIGIHSDPFSPFDLTTTGLRTGATNTLRVEVSNVRAPSVRHDPWWNWGGIDRPVWLQARGPAHIQSLSVRPFPSAGRWGVQIGGTIVGDTGAPQSATVSAKLTAPDGTTSTAEVAEPTGTGLHTRFAFPMTVQGNAELWTPEHPALYDAQISTVVDGRTVQTLELHIGLRTVTVVGGRLLLNGAPLTLHGAGITEDVPGSGDALTPAGMDGLVGELKSLGANVTRAHYPLDERLLDRLDAAGIFVWNDAPVIHADTKLASVAGRRSALNSLRRSLLATRNHPSVLVDAVANELSTAAPKVPPGTRAYLAEAVRIVRGLDPGRPVALDVLAYPNYPAQPIFRSFDVLGINAYFGWYPGRRGNPLPGVNALDGFLSETHGRYPNQALVLSEFGAEAFKHGSPALKGTYEFQSDYARAVLRAVTDAPFMNGAIYWTLRDFAIMPGWTGGPIPPPVPGNPYFHKGLLDYHGHPKPAFAVVQGLYAAGRP